jgi:hypothetical protein
MAEVVPVANGAAPGSDSSIVPPSPSASGTAPGASGTATSGTATSGTATSGTSALSATEPSGDEVGEPIAVDEFQGDILGRKYCVGKTPEGDYFFDYAKPPPGCDLSKIKFFRVTGASMGEVEAELKKLLGTVNASSSTANTPVSSTGRPAGLVERSPVTVNWLQTTQKLAEAARINRSGLRGGNVTRKDKKSRKETSRKQSK